MHTPEACAAYVMSQVVAAQIEAAAMQAANANDILHQRPVGYGYASFIGLIDKYGLGHNAVLGVLQQ